MFRMLKILKKRFSSCIVQLAQIVVEFFSSKAFCQYLCKKLLIAVLRSVLFDKIKKTQCEIKG